MPAKLWKTLLKSCNPAVSVIRGNGNLEGQRVVGMIVNQVNFAGFLSPVINPNALLIRKSPKMTRRHILDENAHFGLVIHGGRPSQKRSISDSAIHKKHTFSAALDRLF